MVEIRADVHFINPITHYVNDIQKKRQAIVLNLSSFWTPQWTTFKKEYDFVETSPLLMDARCCISGKEFLSRFGETHAKAIKILEKETVDMKGDYPFLSGVAEISFYKEIQINKIKEVELCIIELW